MPLLEATEEDRRFMRLALDQARESYYKGGIPVGSVLVCDGAVVAVGRNRSRELNDPTSHAETDCLRNAGFREDFEGSTLYTTLSPCMMCAGAALFLGIPRLVIGDRENYPGDIPFLLKRGIELVLLDDPECIALMRRFTIERPDLWNQTVSGDDLTLRADQPAGRR